MIPSDCWTSCAITAKCACQPPMNFSILSQPDQIVCLEVEQMWPCKCWSLPARRYASTGYSDRNVSVRPSVTRRYCVKTKKASVMISSPSGSPKTLVF